MTIPTISPVAPGIDRPLWSVMIPTYNCARFLRQTLESVLGQDPGPDRMQIEVVDDCSTRDKPDAVVREVGKGRVSFFRNSKNAGVSENFNMCLKRSHGHLVHILHGDDFVADGFYHLVGRMAEDNPNCAFFATRAITVDEAGIIDRISRRTKTLEQRSNNLSEVVMFNPFRTPAVVIRRSFYEHHGGFDDELIHCADWEMWVRAIHQCGGVTYPEPLARYRSFDGNDSSRLVRTGENVRDHLRLVNRFTGLPGFQRERFLTHCADLARRQARRFASIGDTSAAKANLGVYREVESLPKRLARALRAGARRTVELVTAR